MSQYGFIFEGVSLGAVAFIALFSMMHDWMRSRDMVILSAIIASVAFAGIFLVTYVRGAGQAFLTDLSICLTYFVVWGSLLLYRRAVTGTKDMVVFFRPAWIVCLAVQAFAQFENYYLAPGHMPGPTTIVTTPVAECNASSTGGFPGMYQNQIDAFPDVIWSGILMLLTAAGFEVLSLLLDEYDIVVTLLHMFGLLVILSYGIMRVVAAQMLFTCSGTAYVAKYSFPYVSMVISGSYIACIGVVMFFIPEITRLLLPDPQNMVAKAYLSFWKPIEVAAFHERSLHRLKTN